MESSDRVALATIVANPMGIATKRVATGSPMEKTKDKKKSRTAKQKEKKKAGKGGGDGREAKEAIGVSTLKRVHMALTSDSDGNRDAAAGGHKATTDTRKPEERSRASHVIESRDERKTKINFDASCGFIAYNEGEHEEAKACEA